MTEENTLYSFNSLAWVSLDEFIMDPRFEEDQVIAVADNSRETFILEAIDPLIDLDVMSEDDIALLVANFAEVVKRVAQDSLVKSGIQNPKEAIIGEMKNIIRDEVTFRHIISREEAESLISLILHEKNVRVDDLDDFIGCYLILKSIENLLPKFSAIEAIVNFEKGFLNNND